MLSGDEAPGPAVGWPAWRDAGLAVGDDAGLMFRSRGVGHVRTVHPFSPAPGRKPMRFTRNGLLALSAVGAIVLTCAAASPAAARTGATASAVSLAKQPVAVGTGGAVASDDVEATSAGLDVLRHGGNAVDAAAAVAAG